MEVLKTASPQAVALAPKPVPRKIVPSSSANTPFIRPKVYVVFGLRSTLIARRAYLLIRKQEFRGLNWDLRSVTALNATFEGSCIKDGHEKSMALRKIIKQSFSKRRDALRRVCRSVARVSSNSDEYQWSTNQTSLAVASARPEPEQQSLPVTRYQTRSYLIKRRQRPAARWACRPDKNL